YGEIDKSNHFGEVLNLSTLSDYKEAAHNLYTYIRQLDIKNYSQIIALRLPDEGLGRAINDRLQRAAIK
ncbi:MAG: hypothetical protein KF882_05910, partial [Bacteroidia bacterium]|nr:hypothetical protein [Bacteroidia bacterium]